MEIACAARLPKREQSEFLGLLDCADALFRAAKAARDAADRDHLFRQSLVKRRAAWALYSFARQPSKAKTWPRL